MNPQMNSNEFLSQAMQTRLAKLQEKLANQVCAVFRVWFCHSLPRSTALCRSLSLSDAL
jgi:hypothetical protein